MRHDGTNKRRFNHLLFFFSCSPFMYSRRESRKRKTDKRSSAGSVPQRDIINRDYYKYLQNAFFNFIFLIRRLVCFFSLVFVLLCCDLRLPSPSTRSSQIGPFRYIKMIRYGNMIDIVPAIRSCA